MKNDPKDATILKVFRKDESGFKYPFIVLLRNYLLP